ncbi:MAG: type II secretion system protein [Patescibacteria group bacterium]|nr:type II secretion system protein [Patescibacteria group bacterium]MDD5222300.1 type II secretion system protein [Patescibacteria group bacterium]MDD5395737.1 type II secretion system protein [Patescibacteria group bacterium]
MAEGNNKKKSKAFSIIELVVVVFIIGVLSAMTIVNYRTGQRKDDLLTNSKEMLSVIKRSQSMALTGYKQTSNLTNYGYGIYVPSNNSTTYKLYIDQGAPNNYKWDASASDESIEDYTLSPGLIIENAGCKDLVFTRPEGQVYCDGAALTSGANIFYSIKSSGNQTYLYIRINSKGRIDVVTSQS